MYSIEKHLSHYLHTVAVSKSEPLCAVRLCPSDEVFNGRGASQQREGGMDAQVHDGAIVAASAATDN